MENLSVSLLLDDLEDVRKISNVFKQIGILPNYYEDLKSFWNGTLEQMPSIAVVDVKKMSQGEYILKNHPYIQTGELPMVFFYSRESSPLLFSTFEMFTLGTIEKNSNYVGNLKSILRRYNKLASIEQNNYDLRMNANKFEKQLGKAIEELQLYKEEEFFSKTLDKMISEFEGNKGYGLLESMYRIFDNHSMIDEFTVLELSANGTRLISPPSVAKKFKKIPPIWPGKSCSHGIEDFAVNMANHVVLELMGGDTMSLMVYGKHENPAKIVFVKTSDELMLNSFNWEKLEQYLTNNYIRELLRREDSDEKGERVISTWEFLGILDHELMRSRDESSNQNDLCLIDLDFSTIIDFVKKDNKITFYWGDFYKDFVTRLHTQFKFKFTISAMGADHLGVLVDQRYSEKVFVELKAIVSKFSFWKYFEEVNVVLAKTLQVKVQMVPSSSISYLGYLDGTPYGLSRSNTSLNGGVSTVFNKKSDQDIMEV